MKITSVDVWTVLVPTVPGSCASAELEGSDTIWEKVPLYLIRLNTDTEYYGIGHPRRSVTIEKTRSAAALLLGRDPEQLTLQNIYETRTDGHEEMLEVGKGPAYNGFEMAVFDLIGRIRGVPVHSLLGGAVRDRVRADYWMGNQTPEDSKRTVERALRMGFKGVKIKCKLEDSIVERLQAILDVAGPDFKVTIDPNQRFYTAAQTIDIARQLEPLGNVEVLEDPIVKTDMEGWAQINAATKIPLALHCGSVYELLFSAINAGIFDRVNLDGSMFEFCRIASVAAAAGLRCWHGSGNDLGIADLSYVHTAAATPNCTAARILSAVGPERTI